MDDLFDVDDSLVEKASTKKQKRSINESVDLHANVADDDAVRDNVNLEVEKENGLVGNEDDYDYGDDGDVNINEEIKISSRSQRAKLDEERLLSDDHLKRLISEGPTKLCFSSAKGSEGENMRMLIDFYRVWAHNLYPKAKFADVIAIVEKLGHKTSVKSYRKTLIYHEIEKMNTHSVSATNSEMDQVDINDDDDLYFNEQN